MAQVLGFRAEAKQLYWAVVEGTQDHPIIVGKGRVAAPVTAEEAPALAFYRNRAQLTFQAHPHLTGVAIRSPEPFSRGGNTDGARRRLRIEGVLMEAGQSSGLAVTTGALATISSRLGTKQAKRYVEGDELRGLDLSDMPKPMREAVLVAVAQLPKEAGGA